MEIGYGLHCMKMMGCQTATDEISQVFYQRKTNRYNKPVGSFSSHKQYFLVDRDATTGQWVSRKNLRKVAI